MKTQKPRVAVVTKKVEAKKPPHQAPRARAQATKTKLVAALKKLHPMD